MEITFFSYFMLLDVQKSPILDSLSFKFARKNFKFLYSREIPECINVQNA